jgi:hypothetical protein
VRRHDGCELWLVETDPIKTAEHTSVAELFVQVAKQPQALRVIRCLPSFQWLCACRGACGQASNKP